MSPLRLLKNQQLGEKPTCCGLIYSGSVFKLNHRIWQDSKLLPSLLEFATPPPLPHVIPKQDMSRKMKRSQKCSWFRHTTTLISVKKVVFDFYFYFILILILILIMTYFEHSRYLHAVMWSISYIKAYSRPAKLITGFFIQNFRKEIKSDFQREYLL